MKYEEIYSTLETRFNDFTDKIDNKELYVWVLTACELNQIAFENKYDA